jgi:hypothetical protein
MVRAGWIAPKWSSSRKTNPAEASAEIFGLLRRGKTRRVLAAACRSGIHGHQIAFPTAAPADITGFK